MNTIQGRYLPCCLIPMLNRVFNVFVFICGSSFIIQAQTDVAKTFSDAVSRLKKYPLKIYGGLDLMGQYYQSKNLTAYFPDLTYRAMAQLQLDFLGIQAPFSFIYSNGNSIYHLPSYTFAGISPSYKWATLHLGDRSLELSPYTLSGHQFRGIGLELKPGHWRLSAMYGRLKRAVAEDFLALQGLDPSFKRMGWGIKAGYETDNEKIGLTLFHAQDQESSIPLLAHTSTVMPAENLACALQTFKKLGPWTAQFEYTYSLFSRDTRNIVTDETNYTHHILGLFTPRFSSAYRNAFLTRINFNTKKAVIGVQFDHLDPGFRSLGTLYFQDDYENYTIHGKFNALKNKLTVALQSGIQRNYFEKNESNQLLRGIGSAQINFAPVQNFQWQVQWSNISNTVRFRNNLNPNQPLDSLYLVSTQSQAGTTVLYHWGAAQESGLMATMQYQKGHTIVNDAINKDVTNFLFAQTSYTYRAGKAWNVNLGIQYTQNSFQELDQYTIGPNVQYQHSFLNNKFSSSISAVDQEIFSDRVHSHRIINLMWMNAYQVSNKNQIYLRVNQRSRSVFNDKNKNSRDLITELGYSLKI